MVLVEPNYDGHQHLIIINMQVHFFSVEGVCSLSQVLKGIYDSSHMMHSSANTFFLSLTISFSLPPCNSLFSKASQYFSLAVQPIYRKESEKHAH